MKLDVVPRSGRKRNIHVNKLQTSPENPALTEGTPIEKTDIAVGIRYALSAAILFGSTTPIAKHLLRDVHPVLLAAILYMGSGHRPVLCTLYACLGSH